MSEAFHQDDDGPAPSGPDRPAAPEPPEPTQSQSAQSQHAQSPSAQSQPSQSPSAQSQPAQSWPTRYEPTHAGPSAPDPLLASAGLDQPEPRRLTGAELELRRSAGLEPEAASGQLPAPATAQDTHALLALNEPETVPGAQQPDPAASGSALHRSRMAFRRWRRTRPFWGALLVNLGAAEILFTERAPFKVVVHFGLMGLAGYLLPAIMLLCGLLTWFSPAQRTFYALLSMLLALGTWVTSNLGGFIIGMLLGLVGASLAFGWTPNAEYEARVEQRRRRAEQRTVAAQPGPPQISAQTPRENGA